MAGNANAAAKIDPNKAYLVTGDLLKKLLTRKVSGVDGQITVREDQNGNVTLGLSNTLKFYGDENGTLSAWLIPAKRVSVS